MHFNSYPDIDGDVVQFATRCAHSLVRQVGFTLSDFDDIQQELICVVLNELPSFDPSRSKRTTFIARVLQHKVQQMVRNRTRAKRHPFREAFSLNEACTLSDQSDATYAEVVADGNDDAWRLRELIADVHAAVVALPPKLRNLAILHAHLKPSEARKEAGLAKSSHHRAIRTIREYFHAAGLKPGTFLAPTGNVGGRDQ